MKLRHYGALQIMSMRSRKSTFYLLTYILASSYIRLVLSVTAEEQCRSILSNSVVYPYRDFDHTDHKISMSPMCLCILVSEKMFKILFGDAIDLCGIFSAFTDQSVDSLRSPWNLISH